MRIKIENRVQPIVGAIDYGNPISRGLVGCWLLNQQGGGKSVDLCRKVTLSVNNATTIFGKSSKGRGLDSILDGEGLGASTPTHLRMQAPFSIVWFGVFNGTGESNANIFGASYTDSDSSPYVAYSFAISNATNVFVMDWNNGASLFSANTGVTISSNVLYSLVGSFRTTTSRKMYVNGVSRVTDTNTATSIGYATSTLNLGAEPYSSTRNTNCTSFYGLIYNRALDDSEAKILYSRPYCFLKEKRKMFFFPSIVAGNISINQIERKVFRGVYRGIGRGQ